MQGNHGEDVKEYYYYLDAEPKHSFLKMLYKYPCNKFPYKKLLQENAKRSLKESEYELLDTKIFDKNEYFDIFINYAKKSVDDILIKVDICNRSNKKERILILPQVWFRNYWSWDKKHLKKPKLKVFSKNCIKIKHPELEEYFLYAQNFEEILFTENETKYPNKKGFFKDAFHEYFIDKNKKAVNSKKVGTKAAFQFSLEIESKKSKSIILRFFKKFQKKPFENFSKIFSQRKKDADKFYKNLQKGILSKDKKNVQRQALSSLIWSKQFYNYNVYKWLKGDDNFPSPDKNRKNIRNSDWEHLNNSQIILMPDAWEYPWYASWDLCFHTIAYSMLDMEFAKKQLLLLTHLTQKIS